MKKRSFDEDSSWSRTGKIRFSNHTAYFSRAVIIEDGKKCPFAAIGNSVAKATESLNTYLNEKCICWLPRPEDICPIHREGKG